MTQTNLGDRVQLGDRQTKNPLMVEPALSDEGYLFNINTNSQQVLG